MKDIRVASRYARSIFELAEEKGQGEKLVGELEVLGQAVRKQPRFLELLRNPLVKSDEKRVLVNKALAFGVYPYVKAPEAHLYLAKQMWEEANHCMSFEYVLETFPIDRAAAYDSHVDVPSMARKEEFEVKFIPLDLVAHWRRCGMTADFLAYFLSYTFRDQDAALSLLSTVINELLENAVKFSVDKRRPVALALSHFGETVRIQTHNVCKDERSETLWPCCHSQVGRNASNTTHELQWVCHHSGRSRCSKHRSLLR